MQVENIIREKRKGNQAENQDRLGIKKTKLGWIPEDWEIEKFKYIASFFSGGTPNTSIDEYYNGSIRFIRSGEIDKLRTQQFISEIGFKNSSAKMVTKGDLLMALYGANSGEVAI